MKKWIFVFVLIIVAIFVGVFYFKESAPKPPDKVLSAIEKPTATSTVWKQSTVIGIDNVPIRVSWAVVNPKDVELYSNLKEQKLSEEIKVSKNCQTLVSGGFYSEDLKHLGLFVADFETISGFSQNTTLNGFLTIDSTGKIRISTDLPENPRIGLQTGPLLMQNGQPLLLTINNDEPARRIAAATTADNQLIFMVFYREESELEGPLLGNLPEIINTFKKQTEIDIIDAINLDGGSASIFISSYDLLRELSIVGSYFCAK